MNRWRRGKYRKEGGGSLQGVGRTALGTGHVVSGRTGQLGRAPGMRVFVQNKRSCVGDSARSTLISAEEGHSAFTKQQHQPSLPQEL